MSEDVQKAEKQAVQHIDRDHAAGKRKAPARVTASQRQQAQQEAQGGPIRGNPAQGSIKTARKDVQHAYGQIARELAKGDGDDKRLAVDIVKLVQQMPLPLSKHEQRVEVLKEAGRSQGKPSQEQSRQPGAEPERAIQPGRQSAQKPSQGQDTERS